MPACTLLDSPSSEFSSNESKKDEASVFVGACRSLFFDSLSGGVCVVLSPGSLLGTEALSTLPVILVFNVGSVCAGSLVFKKPKYSVNVKTKMIEKIIVVVCRFICT